MKEHRTKALRVTTPHSIESSNTGNKDDFIGRENASDLFGALQILQFELSPTSCEIAAVASTSTRTCTLSSKPTTTLRYSTPSEAMTMHTATITANPVFGKHDSFYRWFSSESEHDELQGNCRNQDFDCDKCNDNQDDQTSKICHCRSTFQKKKLRHKKSASIDSISRSLPLFHSQFAYTILNIVSGDVNENWFLKLRNIKEAISREKTASYLPNSSWCNLKDANGNTVLLVIGQRLLKENQFDKVVELVRLFLEEGADVNVINNENRTLLSYSIPYMDKSIHLTTLLLNYGANVWPISPSEELPLRNFSRLYNKYGSNSDCNSAFTWFLRGVIRQLRLSDHCLQTLYVLAETMGEDPRSMHSHVMTTMFSHARCYSILGPVFLKIKLAMSPYWSQPQSLKFLCRSVIRKSMINEPGRFINRESVSSLMLPPSLQSYLMLEY